MPAIVHARGTNRPHRLMHTARLASAPARALFEIAYVLSETGAVAVLASEPDYGTRALCELELSSSQPAGVRSKITDVEVIG